jgi:dienelactone hydrolase
MAVPGYVYGGQIASLIDCHVMATAAAVSERTSRRAIGGSPSPRFVTASLRVEYPRPTPPGPELEVRGHVMIFPPLCGTPHSGAKITATWALFTYGFLDSGSVGIVGWSHGGGPIALMGARDHPDKFQAAYAGVPISGLVERMGYSTDDYREDLSAPYHIRKTANQEIEEYRRRSPAWNAAKLKTPLLLHTNSNDRDVHVSEDEYLIQALKAEGKELQYKIYQDAPGGYSLNRTDTALACESRREVYDFLARYLKK